MKMENHSREIRPVNDLMMERQVNFLDGWVKKGSPIEDIELVRKEFDDIQSVYRADAMANVLNGPLDLFEAEIKKETPDGEKLATAWNSFIYALHGENGLPVRQ